MRVLTVQNNEEMAQKAADILLAQVILKPDCVLGLATGSTPLGAYRSMAARNKEVSFAQVKTVNLDEYCGLDATSPDSYVSYMRENLFSHIDIDIANTYLPDGMQEDVSAACNAYTALIARLGGIDLQLLGIGHNGHIGFNEPDTVFQMDTHCVTLSKSTLDANAVHFARPADMPKKAITMGMRPIMQAERVLLLAGKEKQSILQEALYGPVTPQVPASILQLHKHVIVIYVAA